MLLKIVEAIKGIAPVTKVSRDPEDPELFIVTVRFPREEITYMKEVLQKSYGDAESRYGSISEGGMDEEGVDAWIYVEGDLNSLDELVERVRRSEDVLGTLELKGDRFGALIYPKGSLSAFAVHMAYLISKVLPPEVKTFPLIGYELTKECIEISVYVSTAEECSPEHEHVHEHGHEHEHENEHEEVVS